MKLFIAGANGGIGRQAVEQALQAGHQVTALVRDPAKLALTHLNLHIVKGDIMQPDTFAHQLKGQQVVISALGVSGGSVKRIFCISASALEISPVIPWYVRLVAKYVIQNLLKHMYADLRRMENTIKASGTDWTIIRPPQLTNESLTGHYRTALNIFLKDCLKISRANVAHFIVNNITNEVTYQVTVEIAD
jgi:putative NADH-flavin reductase